MQSTPVTRYGQRLRPYVQMARSDHWLKNSVMLLGVIAALFFERSLFRASLLPWLGVAFVATCLITSSNYVLNELLDAPTDRIHPVKRHRPAASGCIHTPIAVAEWLVLAIAGLGLTAVIDVYFAASALTLWLMGIVYNVPPIRTKDLPYVDVITESLNNPLRLLLGWFTVIHARFPPLSLLLAWWMAGAFFMAVKRFAEFRQINAPNVAAAYRRSFAHYTEDRLLASVFVYAVTGALFAGIFIVRYRLELILGVPLFAAFLTHCLRLGFKDENPFLEPERLHRDPGFLLYAAASLVVFIVLMFTPMSILYDLFKVGVPKAPPLWILDRP